MWKKILMATLAAALMTMASVASAAPARARARGDVKKKTVIFKGTGDIEGSVLGPNGGWLKGYEKVVFESLIEYRMDFTPELSRAGDLY